MTRFRIKIQPGCNMDSYIVSCLGVIPKHKLQGSYPSCACLWPKSALTGRRESSSTLSKMGVSINIFIVLYYKM